MARHAPRLPFAVLRGGDPDLTITDADWKQIEDAYGRRLDAELRDQINRATWVFLALAPSELAAEPAANARRKIELIEAAAAKLRDAILETPNPIRSQAATYAHHLIDQNLRDTRINGKLQTIGSAMVSVVQACQMARSKLHNSNWRSGRKGGTWRHWILELSSILSDKKLPIKARKDSDKTDASSPFVALVDKLQSLLPKAYRQSSQSKGALAKAVHVARDAKRSGGPSNKSRPTKTGQHRTRPRSR
jgi:hypothetical protein